MKPLFIKELKYYRLVLNRKDKFYFQYDYNIKEHEYIDLTLLDLVETINKTVLLSNATAQTLINLQVPKELASLKDKIAELEKKIVTQGDLIVSLLSKIDNKNKSS